MISITQSGSLLALASRLEARVRTQVRRIVEGAVFYIDAKVHERTPVHAGIAVRNMIWTMDSPNTQEFAAIEDPASPGQTAKPFPLGPEPRRPSNTAAARQSLRALNFSDPFRVFILSNTAYDITELEYGQYPTPGMSRSPRGMFAITVEEVRQRLNSGARI